MCKNAHLWLFTLYSGVAAALFADSRRSFRRNHTSPHNAIRENNSSVTFASGKSLGSAKMDMAAMRLGMRSAEQQCNIVGLYKASPSMCSQGHAHWSSEELKAHVPKFMAFWKKQKQVLPNHCCMGINHMFALHFLVTTLKPAAIIESGVAAGHQTFMLREAAPKTTRIFSIDPGDPAANYGYGAFGAWKDTSGMTTYLTGAFFQDLSKLNWAQLIPDEAVRAKTLVILDDHQSCVERFKLLQRWGFHWAFYEDNYPFKVATSNDPYTCPDLGKDLKRDFDVVGYALGDAYSPNAACGAPYPIGQKSFWYKDSFGLKCELANVTDHGNLLRYLQKEMQVYFEFPALFTPCKSARPAILGNNTEKLPEYGLPPVANEIWNYGHLFPSFVDLRALSESETLAAWSDVAEKAVGLHATKVTNSIEPKKLGSTTFNASLRHS
jgi:hypothetical protein